MGLAYNNQKLAIEVISEERSKRNLGNNSCDYALILQPRDGVGPDDPYFFNTTLKVDRFVDENISTLDSRGLPLNSIESECLGGTGKASVRLSYGTRKLTRRLPQIGLYELTSDTQTQSETKTISDSLDFVHYIDPDAHDKFPPGIGWNAENGSYEGVQVEIGYQTWTERWGFPASYNNTYFVNLYAQASLGCVNQAMFRGCEPGTVKCNGISHRMLFSTESNMRLFDVTFSFSWRPNTYNIQLTPELFAPRKYGWGYLESIMGYDKESVINQGQSDIATFPVGVKHHLVYPPLAFSLFETYPIMNHAELRNRFLIAQ